MLTTQFIRPIMKVILCYTHTFNDRYIKLNENQYCQSVFPLAEPQIAFSVNGKSIVVKVKGFFYKTITVMDEEQQVLKMKLRLYPGYLLFLQRAAGYTCLKERVLFTQSGFISRQWVIKKNGQPVAFNKEHWSPLTRHGSITILSEAEAGLEIGRAHV